MQIGKKRLVPDSFLRLKAQSELKINFYFD